jgi:glycosyltransferase involved in cell wall biosynthesis
MAPRLSGAEILVARLSAQQASAGGRVVVIALLPPEPSFAAMSNFMKAAGVRLIYPERNLSRTERLGWCRAHFTVERVDVAFAHSVIPSAYGRCAAVGTGTKVVTVLHSATQDDYKDPLLHLSEVFIPLPSGLIAVAWPALVNYRNRQPYFVGPSSVILNGVPIKDIVDGRKKRLCVREDVFKVSSEDRKIIIQIGRIARMKRQHITIEAYNALNNRCPGMYTLVLVGIAEDTTYEAELRSQIHDCGSDARIIWLGPRTDIYELLGAADVYLMPSADEAFSVAFVEALCSGIPIVASDIKAFAFARGVCGVTLVPQPDTELYVSAIASAVSVRPPLPRNIDHYGIEETARQYDQVARLVLPAGGAVVQ